MDDRAEVEALIERLVRAANLRDECARDELRRELATHFEDCGGAPGAVDATLLRFGNGDEVAARLRRAHRHSARVLYAARLATSVVVSTVVALAFQALCTLPLDLDSPALTLWPRHALGVIWSVTIVVTAVVAWEIGARRLCTRLERRPATLLTSVAVLSAGMYVTHLVTDTAIAPGFALAASGTSVAAWMSTIAIVARLDLAYLQLFGSTRP